MGSHRLSASHWFGKWFRKLQKESEKWRKRRKPVCRVLMRTPPSWAMAAPSTADLMERSSEAAVPRSEDIKAEGWCRGDSNFQVLPSCPVSFGGNYRRVPWQDEEVWIEQRGAMLRLAHTPMIDVLINSVGESCPDGYVYQIVTVGTWNILQSYMSTIPQWRWKFFETSHLMFVIVLIF